jgi:hypothetical protein
MDGWQFFEYITDDHKNPYQIWYGTLSWDVQAEFDLVISLLAKTEDWDANKKTKKQYKELTREHLGLTQIIFEVAKQKNGKRTQYRSIGIMSRVTREFILLNGFEKHGTFGRIPADALIIAMRLKSQYEQSRGALNDHYHF